MEFVKGWPKEQEYWIFVLIAMIPKKKKRKKRNVLIKYACYTKFESIDTMQFTRTS